MHDMIILLYYYCKEDIDMPRNWTRKQAPRKAPHQNAIGFWSEGSEYPGKWGE